MDTVTISEKVEKFVSTLGKPTDESRNSAYQHLLGLDFPTSRDEYWKYTRVGKISKGGFKLPTTQSERINLNDYIVANDYLVIENGIIRSDISQYSKLNFDIEFVDGESVQQFDNKVELNKDDIFTALNDAYFSKAVQIKISQNKVNEGPLQIIYVEQGEGFVANNRIQIIAEKSSSNEIIQTFVSKDGSSNFVNHLAQYYVEENAQLTIHTVQNQAETTSLVSTTQVKQEANSTFRINTITMSGLLIRNNINIAVEGQNCETYMNGAAVTKGKMHVDNHTFVDHQVSNCMSDENYKYVLGDQSTGVFNGKVIVRQDAQVINAYQNNGNILLSDQATVNSKPELEIYADDVKCSHGSTTGQLDEDAMFYLQARGISKDGAKQLLVSAFINEVIDSFSNPQLIDLVERLIEKEHGWSF